VASEGIEIQGDPPDRRGARAALAVFAVAVVVAFPVILKLGSFHWFLRDEWSFLAGRELTRLDDLFRPHALTHWSTLPVIVYRVLWKLVGVRSYVPYQACVVALHLSVVVMLRMVMRRAGVGPWLATAGAVPFILFGPGSQNILWAFQIGFTGSIAFGLAHLLLSSHEGRFDRRDAFGLLCGLLALMCSGVGITMALVVGVSVLVQRGWRLAAVHTAPLAAVYGLWALVEQPETTTAGFGYPTIGTIARWVRSSEVGTFTALGRFQVLAAVYALLLVVGLALAWRAGEGGWRRSRVALPAALLAGGIAFSLSTVMGRWPYGSEFARASRYLYIGAAFTLPALAVAADALARRWRMLAPVLAVLLLLPIPFNLDGFRDDVFFGRRYFDSEERLLRTVVRVPFARKVPQDVRPIPDVFHSRNLTIGFLLDAERTRRLRPSSGPIPVRERNEMRLRLGVAQRFSGSGTGECHEADEPVVLRPERGERFVLDTPVDITIVGTGGRAASPRLAFLPTNGRYVTVELPDLVLRLAPRRGASGFTWCDAA
jgi:hypothetical protein